MEEDLAHLESQSSKEIFAEALLMIYSFAPIPNGTTEEDYDSAIKKALKFENIYDNNRLRACIDIIEDTECAIEEFYDYGLYEGKSRLGEKYLRLYGVLNAAYIQTDAIIQLIELFKLPNKKKYFAELKKLKIHEVRNKIASHPTTYRTRGTEKEEVDYYRLTQTSLTREGKRLTFSSVKGDYQEINLLELFKEFKYCSDKILLEICKKALNSVLRNNSNDKKSIETRLEISERKIVDFEFKGIEIRKKENYSALLQSILKTNEVS